MPRPNLLLKDFVAGTAPVGHSARAEHLMEEGHKVEIIPRGEDASPDLRGQAIGGTEDWVNIESYQPRKNRFRSYRA